MAQLIQKNTIQGGRKRADPHDYSFSTMYSSFLLIMHCGDMNGKEVQKVGDTCICMADSFCCTVETNTTL